MTKPAIVICALGFATLSAPAVAASDEALSCPARSASASMQDAVSSFLDAGSGSIDDAVVAQFMETVEQCRLEYGLPEAVSQPYAAYGMGMLMRAKAVELLDGAGIDTDVLDKVMGVGLDKPEADINEMDESTGDKLLAALESRGIDATEMSDGIWVAVGVYGASTTLMAQAADAME